MKHEDAISVPQSSRNQAHLEANTAPFDYREAFSRNIGWVTEWEQQELRRKRIAIAGLGGVGGSHLLALARLGIGRFNIADLDRFDVANFNRQAGAAMSTLDRDKVEVMAGMARDINPELDIRTFPRGVDEGNLDAFLEGVDLYVDGLDFFVMDVRRRVFARCAERGIPAITAGPIGFGAAYIVFMPGRMTFEQLFRMEGLPLEKQYVNFAVGLAPAGFHRSYLVDPSRMDLAGKRGPSTAAAINICAGVIAAEAAKILLRRGRVEAAPRVHQFDAFRARWRRSYLPFGNAGPLQSLKRAVGYRAFGSLSRNARPAEAACDGDEIDRILDLARWAPSGDNSQRWRIEHKAGEDRVTVHVPADSENIYDFAGRPTLLSAGALLETMKIAATGFGRTFDWDYLGIAGGHHRIDCRLPQSGGTAPDPLLPYIPIRSVNRWPFRTDPLTAAQKDELAAAVGQEFEIVWHEDVAARLRETRINMLSTDLRLRLRAAHDVHCAILDWDRPFPPKGVPIAAVGLDALTVRLMRWVMADWRRVDLMNRFLGGTVMPRLQLDLVPGLRCAAHFSLWRRAPAAGDDPAAQLRAGQAVQRFWLTLTRLGLVMQPAIAPIVYAWYARHPEGAPDDAGNRRQAKRLNDMLFAGGSRAPDDLVYRGRVGVPTSQAPASRSLRLPLSELKADQP